MRDRGFFLRANSVNRPTIPEFATKPEGDNLVDQAYQLLRHIPGASTLSVKKGTCGDVLEEWKNKSPEKILGKYVKDLESCKQMITEDRGLAIRQKDYYSKQDFDNVIKIYNLLDQAYRNYVTSQKPEDNQDLQKSPFQP